MKVLLIVLVGIAAFASPEWSYGQTTSVTGLIEIRDAFVTKGYPGWQNRYSSISEAIDACQAFMATQKANLSDRETAEGIKIVILNEINCEIERDNLVRAVIGFQILNSCN